MNGRTKRKTRSDSAVRTGLSCDEMFRMVGGWVYSSSIPQICFNCLQPFLFTFPPSRSQYLVQVYSSPQPLTRKSPHNTPIQPRTDQLLHIKNKQAGAVLYRPKQRTMQRHSQTAVQQKHQKSTRRLRSGIHVSLTHKTHSECRINQKQNSPFHRWSGPSP